VKTIFEIGDKSTILEKYNYYGIPRKGKITRTRKMAYPGYAKMFYKVRFSINYVQI